MSTNSETRRWPPTTPAGWLSLVLALILGLLLLAVIAAGVYARLHAGRIYPGVHLAGTELGGLTQAEAADRLARMPLVDGSILLRDPEDERSWEIPSEELGFRVDPDLLAEQALALGRDAEGPLGRLIEPLRLRRSGYDLAQWIAFEPERARARLEVLASEVVVPPENARLERQDGQLAAIESEPGRVLDVDATLQSLAGLAARPITDSLDIAVGYTAARIFDLSNVSQAYELITSGPIELVWREGQSFDVPLEQLEAWTRIERVDTGQGDRVPSIIIDRDGMREWLAPLADQIDHPPRDARYAIDPATGRFALLDGGEEGSRFDLEGSVDRLIRAAYTQQRVGELAVERIPQQVGGDLLRELNTNMEEIGRVATEITGSPTGRMQNLLVAAERLDGLTLAPGQEVGFLSALGEVSEAEGYNMFQLLGGAPGPVPSPSPSPTAGGPEPTEETVPAEDDGDVAEAATAAPSPTPFQIEPSAGGLAGGITQVASTIYRAAFWAGLPILERHAPPVRIGWLEPPIGMDATVFPGRYDLRFANDTEGYLVFDLELDAERGLLVSRLYGRADQQRRVEMIGPTVRDVQPAARPTTLREPGLPSGQSQQIGWAREGAAVLIERRVWVDGQARPPELFASRYAPAGDLVVIGTGP